MFSFPVFLRHRKLYLGLRVYRAEQLIQSWGQILSPALHNIPCEDGHTHAGKGHRKTKKAQKLLVCEGGFMIRAGQRSQRRPVLGSWAVFGPRCA